MNIIGCGQTGSKLATLFDKNPILFSTAHQDSANFKANFKVNEISQDGAGKRFSTGLKIWESNEDIVKNSLKEIRNDKVVIFSSLGGGSGSSSISFMSKILLEQNNKILIVGILPYKKELNPPLSNAVQSVNSLMPIISEASVLLFDNDKLLKKYENDWSAVNNHIIKRVSYLVNLFETYTVDKYSPFTIDRSELESVVFGGGFVDVSDDFLEEGAPKFTYGKVDSDTKNLLIALFCDLTLTDKQVDEYHKILTGICNKFASRAKNSRLITGVLRGKIEYSRAQDDAIKDRAYITIASGLGIDHYLRQIEKIRDDAMERATNFSSKVKVGNIVSKKDANILDI